MKKLVICLMFCFVLLLSGCVSGYSEQDIKEAKKEAYDNGYDAGYSAGKQYKVDNYEPHDCQDYYEPDPDDMVTMDELFEEFAEEYGYYKAG